MKKCASKDEIKKKFRNLAKKYHPDLNKDKVNANEDFIKLKEAYDTQLSPDKTEPEQSTRKSTIYPKYTEFESFFNIFFNDIGAFFRSQDNNFIKDRLDSPEPFTDLRKIVRDRKRKSFERNLF
ncbi:MAG: DnaJ domain-containing protein [Candidatus Odinarchaeota archaeon]